MSALQTEFPGIVRAVISEIGIVTGMARQGTANRRWRISGFRFSAWHGRDFARQSAFDKRRQHGFQFSHSAGETHHPMTATVHNIRERIATGALRMRLGGVLQMVMGGGGKLKSQRRRREFRGVIRYPKREGRVLSRPYIRQTASIARPVVLHFQPTTHSRLTA